MGNVNKEKLEEKFKTSGWSKLRTATRIASQFKNLNPPPTPGKTSHVHIAYRMIPTADWSAFNLTAYL